MYAVRHKKDYPISLGATYPLALLGLLLLPLVVWIERRAWTDLPRGRRTTVLICRLLQVTCLVLALSGVRWERVRDEVCVLFAIDASRSVPDEARSAAVEKIRAASDVMRADDQAGVIVFGRQPLIESSPQSGLQTEGLQSQPDPDYTDLSSLVRLSAGVFPEGMRRRLVVFSDGNENRGNTLEALREAQAAGISIDVFPIEAPPRNEVSLSRLDIPGRVEREQPFEVKVEAVSSGAGPATLRLYRDGAPLGSRELDLREGRNQYTLTLTEEDAGFHTYEAVLESVNDVRPDNNVAAGFTRVSGPQRILLVGSEQDNAALENAFDLSKVNAEGGASLPTSLAGLQDYDAVLLNNVSAVEFAPSQLENIERYVKDLGGGFGMIGGENGFGPGGWIGTPVEATLPVNMELKSKERFPSLALVMAIDKSGSMGGNVGGGSKMDLANRAAVEAVQLLGPRDLVGVIAFDSAGKWVAPITSAQEKADLTRRILSIRSGGGTDAYQGARMGFEALAAAQANLKHLILLTDGHTAPSDFVELVGKMNEAGITLTTIAIGQDSDQTFLRELAEFGRGRYYFCPDPSRVPRIFVRETILVQRSYIIEETARPERTSIHPIMEGEEVREVPPLHGWIATEPKDRSEVILRIKNDPLLAAWQAGLGKAIAYTSDVVPRWAKDWVGSSGFVAFWDRAARWVLRGEMSSELHPRVELDRGEGRVIVDAADLSGERLNFLQLKARVVRPDMTSEEITLRQTALGHYEGEFNAEMPGAYLAGIYDGEGRQASAGGMVAFSPEFKDFGSNDYLLHEMARQTGGKVKPRLDEIFRREGPIVRSSKEVTFELLIVALVLLLIEVAVRRLYLDEERRERLRRWLARWLPAGREPLPAGGPGRDMGIPAGLKDRSRAVRSRLRRGEGAAPAVDIPREPEGGGTAEGESAQAGPGKEEAPAPPKPAGEAPPQDTLSALRARRKREESPAGGPAFQGFPKERATGKGPAGRGETPPSEDRDRETAGETKGPAEEGDASEMTSRLLKAKRRRRGDPNS